MTLGSKFSLFIAMLLAISLSSGCASGKNLKAAKQVYDRVEPGMSREDACWNFEVSCDNVQANYSYGRDVGKSFSGNEYTVTIYIKDNVLARVEITKPHYKYWKWGVRNSDHDKAKIIEEKGMSYEEVYKR